MKQQKKTKNKTIGLDVHDNAIQFESIYNLDRLDRDRSQSLMDAQCRRSYNITRKTMLSLGMMFAKKCTRICRKLDSA